MDLCGIAVLQAGVLFQLVSKIILVWKFTCI